MNKIKITKFDFGYLNKVNSVNKYHARKGPYDTYKNELKAKDYITRAKVKMKMICDELENDPAFDDFEIGISNIRIRTQKGGIPGKYREHVWIWLVNKNLYKRLKAKGIQMPQLSLPQLQVSIHLNDFTTAEIWLERLAMNDWRDKLCSFILDNPIKSDKIKFYLWERKRIFWEYGNKKNTNKFINELSSNHKVKGGFGRVYSKTEILKVKNIYSLIRRDLLSLIQAYYNPIVGYSKASSVTQPLRNRKESYIKTLKKIFRKGTDPTEVNQIHKEMQRKYAEKLKKIYGESNVKTEEKFIDIRVNQKNKVTIYEFKTHKDSHRCIRSAIGQLLFYSWRLKFEEKVKSIELIVMGLGEAPEIDAFYNHLKKSLKIELKYMKYPYKIS